MEREQGNYYMSGMFDGCSSFNQSLEAWKVNSLAHAEGMEGMFVGSPAAELPFVAKWRAAGCQLDEAEVEELMDEEYLEDELEEQ
ncbi:MAG: BspA family leucine-rich repeat surface protein [Bacteroides sp.]